MQNRFLKRPASKKYFCITLFMCAVAGNCFSKHSVQRIVSPEFSRTGPGDRIIYVRGPMGFLSVLKKRHPEYRLSAFDENRTPDSDFESPFDISPEYLKRLRMLLHDSYFAILTIDDERKYYENRRVWVERSSPGVSGWETIKAENAVLKGSFAIYDLITQELVFQVRYSDFIMDDRYRIDERSQSRGCCNAIGLELGEMIAQEIIDSYKRPDEMRLKFYEVVADELP